MATLPPIKVKNLGQYGIITDQPPADLPNNAFTYGSNVRFLDGKVTRAPILRRVFTPFNDRPTHVTSVNFTNGFDRLFMASDNWTISEYESGVEIDVSPEFQPDGTTPWKYTEPLEGPNQEYSSENFSSTIMGDTIFINRRDRVPVYKNNNILKFAPVPGWDASWRANVIRSFKNTLVAFNYVKGGLHNPYGIMWSDFVIAGELPDTWGATPENSAGENTIAELTGPIVDAQVLRDSMYIYSNHEIWRMDYVGGNDVFAFSKAFAGVGAINTNCVVEVEGKHYVFSTHDIIVHDGNTYKSLVDGRVKEFILKTMNSRKADKFFVFYSKRWKEVYFCYVAGGDTVSYPRTTGCNRAAVYNIQSDTWSFMDLPNVYSATSVNIEVSYLWGPDYKDELGNTVPMPPEAYYHLHWDSLGGSWYDLEDSHERHTVIASRQLNPLDAPNHVRAAYALDTVYNKTAVPFEIDTIVSLPPFVRRDYIDLDTEDGDVISANRVLNRILPQGKTYGLREIVMRWKIGTTMYPAGQPNWKQTDITFRHEHQYKIDSRASGRYLSYEVQMPTYDDFELSSMDLIVTTTARR